MIVALLQVELHLPASNSLKDKRAVLQSLLKRLRNKLNVAVAEIGDLDLHRKALIAAATVSNSRVLTEKVLRAALALIEQTADCEILNQRIEYL